MTTMIAEPIVAEPKKEALTLIDRCDRCSAAALVRIEFQDGAEMFFCMHDFRKNEAKFQEIYAKAWNSEGEPIQFGLSQVDFYKFNTPSAGVKELDHA